MWELRGNVPTSVDCTANFVELLHQFERLKSADPRGVTSRPLRLSAAMAIVRFVNGIVDPEQKSVFAKSVLGLAAGINLPIFLVDLRHDSTHNELPPLETLRVSILKVRRFLLPTLFLCGGN